MSQTSVSSGRGERLSRGRILDTALDLVSRDGLETLSMRRLAQELDVWPMSIYRYFHDKEELVAALADAAAGDIASPSPAAPWTEQMRGLLAQARAILERHPGSLRPQDGGPAAARVRDVGLAILGQGGLTGEEAELAWRALMAYTAGAAAIESSATDFHYGLGRLLAGFESGA